MGPRGERSVTEPAKSGWAPWRRWDEGRGEGHSWRGELMLRQRDPQELVCQGSSPEAVGSWAAGEAREMGPGAQLPCREAAACSAAGGRCNGRPGTAGPVVIHGGSSIPRS